MVRERTGNARKFHFPSASCRSAEPGRADCGCGKSSLAEDARRILLRWLIGLRWAVFLLLAGTRPLTALPLALNA
jgi:hypothetical protein